MITSASGSPSAGRTTAPPSVMTSGLLEVQVTVTLESVLSGRVRSPVTAAGAAVREATVILSASVSAASAIRSISVTFSPSMAI